MLTRVARDADDITTLDQAVDVVEVFLAREVAQL
jgi:hypothetical protein